MQVLTNIINSQCNVWQREGNDVILFQPGSLSLSAYADENYLGIPFIEDLHKASLFSLATILSVGVFLSQSPTIWCDKVSSLAIASNPVFHARTKHIEV